MCVGAITLSDPVFWVAVGMFVVWMAVRLWTNSLVHDLFGPQIAAQRGQDERKNDDGPDTAIDSR
jgi:hypothetical protein